ncbi:MAG: putative ABC transporter ATP-binding protein [Candidatus Ordinivivax streblomastigis]|uniref:Putative ABC transporter ATP-binding protein n=1 Tax=Candidatus Ordinivivax streblomastigis TaxID=2540710 RepID=A0A5M8NY55_9BACT|nr:MAG: putative ABC transporter ATP-binding protein [Candidatus Ordinivivax streblomastigis]
MIKKILSITSKRAKALIAAASLSSVAAGLLWAYIIYLFVDTLIQIFNGGSPDALNRLWIQGIILLLVKTIMVITSDLTRHWAGFEVMQTVRIALIRKLKQFSLGFYSRERLGEISTVVHKDVDNLESVLGHLLAPLISDVFIALALGIWLFSKNVVLGLCMFSTIPLAVVVLLLGLRKSLLIRKQTGDDLANMVSLFVEYTKGIPLMKAFSENTAFEQKLNGSIRVFGASSALISKMIAKYTGQFSFFFELARACMVIVGGVMLYQGSITLELFLLFVIFSAEFYKPFEKIELYFLDYLKVKDSYNRVYGILEAPVVPLSKETKEAKTFDIVYENVGFSYESNEFAMKNVSFTLPQGSLTALVGTSGSGKTTVTNLLLRFWDADSGSIKIGGVNILDMDYDRLLSDISIVMQNVHLTADTILENIRFGKQNTTKEQVIEAAKKAQIHDFIAGLPEGYDTKIGENGVGLSGGQKQRLSIARAFLRNAPIVVLDEITSNVDPVNETKIQRAISELAKNKTVLVIAHHLRTIRTADQILVFNKGELAEQGKHAELLEQQGLYAHLWEIQQRAGGWKIVIYI